MPSTFPPGFGVRRSNHVCRVGMTHAGGNCLKSGMSQEIRLKRPASNISFQQAKFPNISLKLLTPKFGRRAPTACFLSLSEFSFCSRPTTHDSVSRRPPVAPSTFILKQRFTLHLDPPRRFRQAVARCLHEH
jgi:hypothetical protein